MSFKNRVDTASRCILGGEIGSRRFDNCFENGDGAAVVVALYRDAQDDHLFKQACLAMFSDRQWPASWIAEVEKYRDIPSDRLARLSASLRAALKVPAGVNGLAAQPSLF